jgi:ankyrin repeat protein
MMTKGASLIERKGPNGSFPIHVAASSGIHQVFDIMVQMYGVHLDARDDTLNTALHWAVRNQQIQTIEVLLAMGADQVCDFIIIEKFNPFNFILLLNS